MENNMNAIPDVIFQWLENKPFEALSENQKAIALTFFSEEEYEEMAQTIRLLKVNSISQKAKRKEKILGQLLGEFDKHHSKTLRSKVVPLSLAPNWIWQAAAAVFFLLSSALAFQFWQKEKTLRTSFITKTDTVFMERKLFSEPVRIFDTIYLVKNEKKNIKAFEAEIHSKPKEKESTKIAFSNLEPVPVVSIQTLKQAANQSKGNSMKDDSLLKKYSYVTL